MIMKAISSFLMLLLATTAALPIRAQDWAIKQLENSPRHQEKVFVKNGDRNISCFLVYPEAAGDATVVILIHENRGLNDWARSMADQVAGEGFIVIAPDFISGKAPGGGDTPDFPNSDAARDAIYELNPDQIVQVGIDSVGFFRLRLFSFDLCEVHVLIKVLKFKSRRV